MFKPSRHSLCVAAAIAGLATGAEAREPRTKVAVLPTPRPHLAVVDCDGQFAIRTTPAAPCPSPLPSSGKTAPTRLDLGLNLKLDRSLFRDAANASSERSDAAR